MKKLACKQYPHSQAQTDCWMILRLLNEKQDLFICKNPIFDFGCLGPCGPKNWFQHPATVVKVFITTDSVLWPWMVWILTIELILLYLLQGGYVVYLLLKNNSIQFSFICTNNSHLKATDVVLIYSCIQLLLFFKAGKNQNEPFHLPTCISHKPK